MKTTNDSECAVIGVDGNCGFALLGPNLQAGEAEFVEVKQHPGETLADTQRMAAALAMKALRTRLNKPYLAYRLGFEVGYPADNAPGLQPGKGGATPTPTIQSHRKKPHAISA